MGKILLVTGGFAASEVKSVARASPLPAEVFVSGIEVAAFLSPQLLEKELSRRDLSGVSLVVVPGSVKGDLSSLSEKLGVSCVKGPRNLSFLPIALEALACGIEFSSVRAADDLLAEDIREEVEGELSAAWKPSKFRLSVGKKSPVFLGGGLMHVVAEIVDAPHLSDEQLQEKAAYYVESGASIVDLGMFYGLDSSEEIPRVVSAVRSSVDVPLSIDSFLPSEILAAADVGIDLVLSLDHTNLEVASSLDVPALAVPRDKAGVPRQAEARVALLEDLLSKLDALGFSKYLADPILDPPMAGFAESLRSFSIFRGRHPNVPLMLGVGNVSEMLDADSPGVNALLAAFAAELDVDLLFTTEASQKTRGAVSELRRSADLMFLAKKRSQPPKDLGVDLLILKDKRKTETVRDPRWDHLVPIKAAGKCDFELEDCSFRISVSDAVEVVYYRNDEPKLRFAGSSAECLYKEIMFRGLIKSMSHAAYLGKELAKAELALKLGKNYEQDRELF